MTEFSTIKKTADQMQVEFRRVTQEFQKKMQSMFTDMTKSFFEAAPEIKAVVWSQYTPYFNDGEECTFSVNNINFLTRLDEDVELYNSIYDLGDEDIEGVEVYDTGATPDELELYRGYAERYNDSSGYYLKRAASIEEALKNPRHAELSELCSNLESVINDNEDLMKAIFGDHVIVTLTADGSNVNECSHD